MPHLIYPACGRPATASMQGWYFGSLTTHARCVIELQTGCGSSARLARWIGGKGPPMHQSESIGCPIDQTLISDGRFLAAPLKFCLHLPLSAFTEAAQKQQGSVVRPNSIGQPRVSQLAGSSCEHPARAQTPTAPRTCLEWKHRRASTDSPHSTKTI